MVSLWPVAFVAWSFTYDESTTSSGSGGGVAETTSAATPDSFAEVESDEPGIPAPGCRRLNQLARESRRLNRRFQDVQLTAGVPAPEIAEPGQELVTRHDRWLERNSGIHQEVLNYARRERRVVATMVVVAESPDEDKLCAFNQAVRHFNRNSTSVSIYC